MEGSSEERWNGNYSRLDYQQYYTKSRTTEEEGGTDDDVSENLYQFESRWRVGEYSNYYAAFWTQSTFVNGTNDDDDLSGVELEFVNITGSILPELNSSLLATPPTVTCYDPVYDFNDPRYVFELNQKLYLTVTFSEDITNLASAVLHLSDGRTAHVDEVLSNTTARFIHDVAGTPSDTTEEYGLLVESIGGPLRDSFGNNIVPEVGERFAHVIVNSELAGI